jgi:hypothetical protein
MFSRLKDDGINCQVLRDEISSLEADIGNRIADLNELLQRIKLKRELLRRLEEAEALTKVNKNDMAVS